MALCEAAGIELDEENALLNCDGKNGKILQNPAVKNGI